MPATGLYHTELSIMLNRKSLLLLAILPIFANAQVQTLKESAQQAILTNPDVLTKWHALQAADGERDVAFGGYLPHVDTQVGAGRELHNEPLLQQDYNTKSQSLTLTQMLYDGFATSEDVARLDHNRLERLYELYDTTESTALDVVRAHLDVLRYRKLVALAEDNYVQHRAVYDQIQSKAKAGVGRRVDLEQSAGRLALAEANLLTDTSNLHDVSARFQRLVGDRPAKEMDEPAGLDKDLPPEVENALKISNKTHPALLAAIESIRAADDEARGRRSAYQPRLDLHLSAQHGTNINSEIGETNDKSANIVLTWNLFNGLSDRAKLHQLAEQINVTRDLRDKVCRDLRQNLEIAYNDNRKIAELLNYLDQHQLSIEKARDAYHLQFDIGQRTLLDLLDTENELFQAKRAYVEAQYDQQFAYARVQAGMGNLFKVLGLTRLDAGPLPSIADNNDESEAARCPVLAPETYVADKSELNQRAAELLKESVPPPETAKSATVSKDAIPLNTGTAVTDVAAIQQKPIADALSMWRNAWSTRNVQAYLNMYAPSFQPNNETSHDEWATKRKARVSGEKQIDIELTNLKISIKDATHAVTTFHQHYRADAYHDDVEKTLEWENVDGHWVIIAETIGTH
jgi:adhesin transport system outer membrane protein